MNIKIAAPLYILRNECRQDLFAVLEQLRKLGYEGVEFLGFFGRDPKEIRKKLDQIGLTAIGNHVDYDEFQKDVQGTIEAHKTVGCKYITISGPAKEQLSDEAALAAYIRLVTEIGKQCREQGVTLLYHNHDRELLVKKEKYVLEEILDQSPAQSLAFEPDLGWMAIGGAQPEYFLEKYLGRCPIIHLKDFYAEDVSKIGNVHELGSNPGDAAHSFFEFRPTGYGIANIPALMNKIAANKPEWLLADHDLAYDRDSYFDLQISLDYIRNILKIVQAQYKL